MTNNAAERALRGIAVGRRNWTFCGSDSGGHRAAVFYTLIETCRLNQVDPRACGPLSILCMGSMDCSSCDPIRAKPCRSTKYGMFGMYGVQKRYRVTEIRDPERRGSGRIVRCRLMAVVIGR